MRIYVAAAGMVVGGTLLLLLVVEQVASYATKEVVAGLVELPDKDGGVTPTAPATEGGSSPSILRVAVAPVFSPEASMIMYRDLVDWLAGKLDMKGEMILRASYAEINEVLRSQQCDAAIVCTYPYVRARRDFGARLLAAPVIKGSPAYRSLVVVPHDSDARSLADLKGKRFASADVLSTSGWLYPAMWLRDRGEDPDRFFGVHVITGGHDRSVLAVASGQADGAAVHSMVYDRTPAATKARTKVIQRSPFYGAPPIVVHPDMPEDLFSRLQDALLSAHDDEKGREVLRGLEIDRFVRPDPESYSEVEKLVSRWEGAE